MDYIKILTAREISFEAKEKGLLVNCPFHPDKTPSGSVHLERGSFICFACGKRASFYEFLAKRTGELLSNIFHDIQKEYGYSREPTVTSSSIEKWHIAILEDEKLLKELRDRGVDHKLIRKYRIGKYQEDRISIPVRNPAGFFVDARLYKPGSKDKKVISLPKYGKKLRLFPVDQLAYDQLLVTGGEVKAIVAAEHLNEKGIGAITGTWGENNWTKEHVEQFRGKIIYVCMDIDEAGCAASQKLCGMLLGVAAEIYKVALPLDIKKYPNGDINDYIAAGFSLLELLDNTPQWEFVSEKKFDPEEPPIETDLTNAVSAKHAKKRLTFKALASAVEPTPFSIPKTVTITCDRNSKYCGVCTLPTACKPDDQQLVIGTESPAILRIVGRSEKEQFKAFCEEFGIPARCAKVAFDPKDYYNVEHACISSELDITNRSSEREMQQAYCIGNGTAKLELNEHYQMEGRMFPNPLNQQATLLISNYNLTQDALTNYKCEDMNRLKLFQPDEWSPDSIRSKLNDVYEDLEANVTRIFKRRAMHLAMDLAYHSPLFMHFDGDKIKAWVETLILGDSAQGKSEILINLIDHYSLGERVDCKGATVAGLLGGVQKFGDRWFITWGKIPNHDRRLVALEELKGTDTAVIGKLTDMRSSGIAEITKIEKRRAHARTRLIGTSNPRSSRPLSSYNYGVDAVVELIGNLEDIRRFDLVLLVERNEVDIDKLQMHRPIVTHKYRADICRELVLWCWTCDDVVFENERTVFETASRLCKQFTDIVPIVDRGSMRLKIGRLAAALAGRTFSTEDGITLLVRDAHIKYMEEFLIEEYSKESFGYDEYSKVQFAAETLVSTPAIEKRILLETKYPKDFITQLLVIEEIDRSFLMDIMGWDHQSAGDMLSFLVRQRALKKEGRIYRKTTSFTKLLKELSSKKNLDDILPSHLKGDQF